MRRAQSLQNLAILGLTLLAFLLRAYRLDFQSYWIDEAWTVHFANMAVSELWQSLRTTEIHPPLYYTTLHYWFRLVNDSEYALRFYSLIFGVLTVPLAYRLGKDLGYGRLGLLVAALTTTAPYQVWHAQDARMYTMLSAASVLSMWGFVNLWQWRGRRWWLVYVIGTEWTLLTHYQGLMLIGLQGLFVLLAWPRRWRRYLAWGGALLVIFVLYLPWLVFSWNILRSQRGWLEQPTLWQAYARSATAFSVGELVPRPQVIFPVIVFVMVYALGLVYAARRRWRLGSGSQVVVLLLAYSAVPTAAAWLYGELRTPVYFERYLIPSQIGYLLTIAMGILAVAGAKSRFAVSKWAKYGSPAVVLLLLLGIDGWVLAHHYFDPAYAKDDWRAVVRVIENFALPGDAVVVTGDGGDKVFDFYYQGDLPVYFDFNTPVPSPEEARQIIAGIVANHRRLWYTPYGVPIDAILEGWLAEHAFPAWQSWLGRKRLALYAGSAITTDRLEQVNTVFTDSPGQGLTLLQAALPGRAIPAGDLLPLVLTWQTAAPPPGDYQLSVRLSNQQSDIFAQSDWPPLAVSTWPPGQPIVDRRSLWLPVDTPPGNYNLQLVVYEPASGQPIGQPVTIDHITIAPAQIVVPLAALSLPQPTRQPVGAITLVGYAIPEKIQPGEEMWAWLYWQAEQTPAPDSRLKLWLSFSDNTGDDTSLPASQWPLADIAGPLDSWQPGQVRRTVYHLPTGTGLRGDMAELKATLSSAGRSTAETVLARVTLEVRPGQFETPDLVQPTNFVFGQPAVVKLVGYNPPASVLAAGHVAALQLFWQAEADMRTSYTVFIQLLNDQNQVVSQIDSLPLGGAAPTTTWRPGEILTDPYRLPLPADLPAGEYRLIAGLYNQTTGERLPVAPGLDFVELQQITVE